MNPSALDSFLCFPMSPKQGRWSHHISTLRTDETELKLASGQLGCTKTTITLFLFQGGGERTSEPKAVRYEGAPNTHDLCNTHWAKSSESLMKGSHAHTYTRRS
jgi:hypothetical protein